VNKPTPKFSMDQLVAELREALPDIDEGGVRTVEVAEALGVGETTVRKLLRG
jgi:DNA-directed RNA polymerase specialized sigma24 family protein